MEQQFEERKFWKIINRIKERELSNTDKKKIDNFIDQWEYAKKWYDDAIAEIYDEKNPLASYALREEASKSRSDLLKKLDLFELNLQNTNRKKGKPTCICKRK